MKKIKTAFASLVLLSLALSLSFSTLPRAVSAHDGALGSAAVLQRDGSQGLVVGGVGGPEDDADVHYDVDEQRLRADERRQVAAHLTAQCQRPACLYQCAPQ